MAAGMIVGNGLKPFPTGMVERYS